MPFVNSLRIATKLPVIILLLCLVTTFSVGALSYFDFRRTLLSEAQENFEVLIQERRRALELWFDQTGNNVAALGNDPTIIQATSAFSSTFGLMTDDPATSLRQAYIADNPYPVGEKEAYDQAPAAIPYNFQHGLYHPFLRQLRNREGYYDMFLFDLDGNLIYSVYKEDDFATNILVGPYKDTGLNVVYQAARDGDAGSLSFADFTTYAPSAGDAAAFVSTPVIDTSGKKIGVVAVQFPASSVTGIVASPIGLGESGELYLVSQDGQARSVSRFDGGHQMLAQMPDLPQIKAALDAEKAFFANTIGVNGQDVIAETFSINIFGGLWGIVGEKSVAEVTAPAVNVRNKMIVIGLAGAVLAAILGWLTARAVTGPLGRLGDAMRAVSDEQYDVTVHDTVRNDEIGVLTNILVDLRNKLEASDRAERERHAQQQEQEKVVDRLSVALTKLADGNLTEQITTPFMDEYDQLRQDYNAIVVKLNQTIGSVVSGANGIHERSSKMSTSSDELSRRTESQAATLEETAAALDELTASVKSAASGAQEVEQIVAKAQGDADESAPVVRNAVSAMTEIEKSSQEIAQIISVIDDIAFQTNLLALNAGVEAARAGDAGRGFAVVASEVRALAQRSSDAAKQIKTLISGSSEQVARGVGLVGQAGEALTKIVDHIGHISTLMTDIASGAQEQSIGLGEINIGVTQLDKVTQQNAAMVEETTVDSHALHDDATRLGDLVAKFELMSQDAYADDPKVMMFKPNRAEHIQTPIPMSDMILPSQATGTDHDTQLWKDF